MTMDTRKASTATIGARVRVHYGVISGRLGTIYNHQASRPFPWHVLLDGDEREDGIALTAEEFEVVHRAEREKQENGKGEKHVSS